MSDEPATHVGVPHLRTFVVLAFSSTRDALKAERILEDESLDVKVVPLPRHRGELCGIALRVSPDDESQASAALDRLGVEVTARDEIRDY